MIDKLMATLFLAATVAWNLNPWGFWDYLPAPTIIAGSITLATVCCYFRFKAGAKK